MSKQTEHTTTNEQTTSLPQQSEDDAQKMMESMFSALLQNPGLSSSLMNSDLGSVLNSSLGKMENNQVDTKPTDILQCNESIHAPDGIQDITSSLNACEDASIPHDIAKTITELEDTRNKKLQLQVKFESDEIKFMYDVENTQYSTDSGWDLRFTEDVTIQPGETHKFDFGVSVCCYDAEFEGCALWLLPRSSIVKTPLRLANSMGLIDSSYRGSLKAYVDNIKSEPFTVKKGERLFQITSSSLRPMDLTVVKELPQSDRGEKGFGSTGL